MDENRLILWLNICNFIVILAIIFGTVFIAIHQNNYWWLFMWAFLFVIEFTDYKRKENNQSK